MSKKHKVRVLVVDDSRVVRVAASKMFGEEFDVLLAVDGADGLNIIERDSGINVVFTDLAMPEMDGFELLRAVRAHSDDNIRNLPIIVATGAGNPETAKHKAFALGATDFITKPFHGTDIKARARSYSELRNENRELQAQTTLDLTTGLLNKKGLSMQLEKEIASVARHESNITLVSVEIDRFKDLFVRIGRQGAETVIERLAKLLDRTFRKEDSISRTGLARFVISMPFSHADSAMAMANRVCQKVENFQAKLDGKPITITVSTGVCTVEPNKRVDVDTLMGMTHEALVRATGKGSSQTYRLSLEAYRQHLFEQAKKTMSIDKLLDDIAAGSNTLGDYNLDAAIERLAPLFAVLSNEQAQKVFNKRQLRESNIVKFGATKD